MMIFFPLSDSPNKKTKDVIYSIATAKQAIAYHDLTGRFPYCSSRGNEYLLIAYNYDGNLILAEPIKNRKAPIITKAWRIMNEKFEQAGMQPNTYILDNEAAAELKAAMMKKDIQYQ